MSEFARERRMVTNDLEKVLETSIKQIQAAYDRMEEYQKQVLDDMSGLSEESREYQQLYSFLDEINRGILALYPLTHTAYQVKPNLMQMRDELEEKAASQVDRYEFMNAVIGWEGTEEVYLNLLKCSKEELDRLVQDPSEELEERISSKLSEMGIQELNDLAERFHMRYEIVDIG